MSLSGRARIRWLVGVGLLLAVVSIAAGVTQSPAAVEEEAAVVAPPEAEDVARGIAEAQQAEREREELLASPAAVAEREASTSAHTDVAPGEAADLLSSAFAPQLEALEAEPGRYLSGVSVVETLAPTVAVVSDEGDGSLLEAGIPIKTENAEGDLEKIDLSLMETVSGFEPQNPLTELQIPANASEPIAIGEDGLSVSQVGAESGDEAKRFGDKDILYFEVAADTDLLVSPLASGVELFDQLRSPASPEQLYFHLGLPDGARLVANGAGGADILVDGETVAYVAPPTAVDAQGTPIAVTLEVEGGTLTIDVPHRNRDVAYPILVDPAIHENYEATWYWGSNVDALNIPNVWQYNTNDPSETYILHNTWCLRTELCSPSGRGLFISSVGANMPANVFGQWYYSVPGGTTYLPSIYPEPTAAINPFWRHNYNCSWESYRQPYDYDGAWDGANWTWFSTDRAQWYGHDTMYTKAKMVAVGLSTGGGGYIPCWRNIMAGGVAVRLDDPEAPTFYGASGTGGWIGASGSVSVTASAYDPGLGVKSFWIHPQGKETYERAVGCLGTKVNPCPASKSGTYALSSGLFDEGERDVEVSASDPTNKFSGTGSFKAKIDRTPPTIELGGQLAIATDETEGDVKDTTGADELQLPVYNLKIEAKDGSTGSPAAKRSGVKNVEVFLDGTKQEVPWTPLPSCSQTSCSMTNTFQLRLTGLEDGLHKLTVIALDFLSQKEERTILFEYIPATGMKEEYVLQRFPLPDGEDHEDGLAYHGPELAVNVMNGNLIFHERDVDVEGYAADLEVERYYNSQLPTGENTEWGDGWTIAQSPDLEPVDTGGTPAPDVASLLDSSGAIESEVALPSESGQAKFNPDLQATMTKEGTDYVLSDRTGRSDEEVVFSEAGRVEETRAASDTSVEYDYQGGTLSEIAIEDPISTTAPPQEIEPPGLAAPTYEKAFGSLGTGNGQLKTPADVAIDASGNLWVADRGNNRIQKFNANGEYLAKFGSAGAGNGQFNSPASIAIDAKGNIWVADRGNNRIQKFNANGEYLSQFGTVGSGNGQFTAGGPEGVAIDAKGNVWVSDTYKGRVQKFSEAGTFIKVVGSKGPGPGQLGEPTGLDIGPGGNVWIADWQYNRIVVFNENGEFVRQFGAFGSGNGQFMNPDAIDVDPQGNVWVGDQENGRIQEFDQSGNYIAKFGSQGSQPGQFQFTYPMGLVTDGNGAIWVADVNNNRVQKWRIPNYLPSYKSSLGSVGSGSGQFKTPADIALDSHGELWVADQGNNRIQHFDPAGDFVSQFGSVGSGSGQLSQPASVAVDSAGNIWVADKGNNRIQKFNPKGEYLAKFGSAGTGNGQFSSPEGVAIDAVGNIWVSDTYNYRIQKFSPTGEFIKVINPAGLGAIEPTGIDAGPFGSVWVTDWSNNRIVELTEAGAFVRQVGSAGSGNGQFNRPDAIDVDGRGDIWVGDQNNSRVQRFNRYGEYVGKFGSAGSGPGQFSFSYPFGIATGSRGRVWVADRNNNRIQRWEAVDSTTTAPVESLPTGDDPSVTVDSEAGLVSGLEGEEAGEHDYSHASDDLVAHDGPAGETKYGYDSAGRMTSVQLPNGTKATIAYNTTYGRVKSVTVDPAGTEPATTTEFEYTDEPRRTKVIPQGKPAVTYDIGVDGSVLKSSNAPEPPKFTDLAGSLYVERETAAAIAKGDKSLLVEARSAEGVASIVVLVGGNTVVDELSCVQDVEKPGTECQAVINEWVVNTGELTPGIVQVEVIATDRVGATASVRFWVNIPYTPPPAPDELVAPKFSQVLNFRKAYGLDLDLDPVADELELNDRVFDLIGAWHNPQTPLGEVARGSWERWGVPLRPVDVAEMEYREGYMEVNIPRIEDWAEVHRPGTYAGYHVDHAAGGILHVGFTSDQAGALAEMKSQASLVAQERLATYPSIPTVSISSLKSTLAGVEAAWDTDPLLMEYMVSTGLDESTSTVEVTGTNLGVIETRLKAALGSQAPIHYAYEDVGIEFAGRNHSDGRIHAGDRLISKIGSSYSYCTGGFGAWDQIGTKANGEAKIAPFALIAGHCAPVGRRFFRQDSGGAIAPETLKEIGHAGRTGYNESQEYMTDGSAILLNGGGLMPYYIFMNGKKLKPAGPAGTARAGETLCFSGVATNDRKCGEMVGVRRRIKKKGVNTGKQLFIITRFAGIPGDSGSPVWSPSTGRSIGLLSGGPAGTGLSKDWVTPLVRPRGFDAVRVPGILNAPGMDSLHLAVPGE